MKKITLEIGQLFDFLREKLDYKFDKDKFIDIDDLSIYIDDENGEPALINALIEKTDDVYETKFDNGKVLRSAGEHLISVEPFADKDHVTARLTKDWEPGDDIPYLKTKCVSNEKVADKQTVYGFSIDTEKHLYKDADGMVHHNTYTAKKTAEKYAPSSGKKFSYFSGAMSSALSSIIPFFYYHSKNEIIMLDDNDAMLMKSVDQKIQNMMKAILDPSALHKPVSVPTSMLDMLSSKLKDYHESADIKIDADALREGRFVCEVNGEVVCNGPIQLSEAQKLSNIIYKKRLDEGILDDDDEDIEDEIADDEAEERMPSEFTFNSSVIFISNLKPSEISPAVADRCEMVDVQLTLSQYMHRLSKILGGLCKGEEYSSRPQYVRDWAKASVYTLLQGIVEAFHRGVSLFGAPVQIRRKFTFRMFEEFCGIWARFATTKAEELGLDLQDRDNQVKIAKLITPNVIKRMLMWMRQAASAR